MKLLRTQGIFLLVCLLPGSIALQAQDAKASETHRFTVQQTVDYAMKNNLTVQNLLLDVKKQIEVNREITAATYPQINGIAGATYNPAIATQVMRNFISEGTYHVLVNEGVKKGNGAPIALLKDYGIIEGQFSTKFNVQAGVTLRQLLFDGQVFVGLQARDAIVKLTNKNVEVSMEGIKANIHKIYYQLVLSKTQLELLDANIARFEKLRTDTKLIYDNGFAEKLDVDKVSVALANLQTEKTKVLNLISNGYYGLKMLIGMPIGNELILTDALSMEQIKEGILESAAYDYNDRKEMQQAQLGKELNEYTIKRYKYTKLPAVVLDANYMKMAQRNKFDFFNSDKWYTMSAINLNISIPIFNGFSNQAKQAQAQIDLDKTTNLISQLKMAIDHDVVAAKNNFKSAILTMDIQKRNMDLAETVYSQTKKKYEVGTGSQTEITASQTELKTAQTNYIQAMYDAIIAKIDYLKAVGKL